jgi:hypothetical protein
MGMHARFARLRLRDAAGAARADPVCGDLQIIAGARRQVSFAYNYNNVAYSRVEASLATGINSTSGWLARKFTTAYQDGASVNVYVNPVNPSEATLNPRSGAALIWLLWLIALAFGTAAYYVAHAA